MSEYVGDAAPGPGTNRSASTTDCQTCGGDRFVTVRLRSPEQTAWMNHHGIKASRVSFHEETAPCPDCHPIEVTYYRVDGSRFRTMDPAAVRQALTQ